MTDMKKNIRFKPSPAMIVFSRIFSAVFALVGLGFSAFGLTLFGTGGAGAAFGLVWTLLSLSFVAIGVYGAANKNGLYGLQPLGGRIEISEDGVEISAQDAPAGESAEERLKQLQSLYDQRLITAGEFEEKRKEILKEL